MAQFNCWPMPDSVVSGMGVNCNPDLNYYLHYKEKVCSISLYRVIMDTMKIIVKKMNEDNIDFKVIQQAGQIIRGGGLVAFPTETVYGLGADALRPEAAKKIYAAKGRPSDNPLIIHICCMQDLKKIVTDVPKEAELLADAFWPGPLTMILKKDKLVPYETTGGMDTAAVRMPSNKIALALIKAAGGFVAAPSANLSGRPSPTLAEHVYEDMKEKIPMILDGGAVGIGIESTIVDLTETVPTVLRPGYITLDMLTEVIGEVQMDQGIVQPDSIHKPKAPGMKYRHYAPKADMILVDGPRDHMIEKINEMTKENIAAGKKVGIIGTQETVDCYEQGVILSIGERQEEETIAHNLYRILREFDKTGVDIIYSESFATPRMGQAIMNRLLKAARHQVIVVK